MTNKEAIEKLKEILFMTGYKEALDLAIKALEERLQGDLISRSELKKEFDATPYNDYDDLLRTERLIDNAQKCECRTCIHRDTEDKKCDCGGQERQGCLFPVSDDYFCKFYEKDGAE